MPEKFWEIYIKNERNGSFQSSKSGPEGPHLVPQAASGRALRWGRAGRPPGHLVAPLAAPFRLYIAFILKPPRTEPFFVISPLFRRHRASKIESTRRPLSGTLS